MRLMGRLGAAMIALLLAISCAGCTESASRGTEPDSRGTETAAQGNEFEKSSALGSMNRQTLLRIDDAVGLLERNGIILSRAMDFPVDLSNCRVYGQEPQPYFSSETGAYYMFYQYDDYSRASELQKQRGFFDFPECSKEFSDYVLPGFAGKNLYVCIYCPDLMNWVSDTSEKERKKAEKSWMAVYEEGSAINDVLDRNAFDQKSLVLIGQGENWEVVVPVNYVMNQMENGEGTLETQLIINNYTYLKYKKSEKEPPRVSTISVSESGSGGSRYWTDGTLLAMRETGYGFYRANGGGTSEFNPEISDGITITIEWGETGQKEEIRCLKQDRIPMDSFGKIPVKSIPERHLEKEII